MKDASGILRDSAGLFQSQNSRNPEESWIFKEKWEESQRIPRNPVDKNPAVLSRLRGILLEESHLEMFASFTERAGVHSGALGGISLAGLYLGPPSVFGL